MLYQQYPDSFGGIDGPIELDYYYMYDNFKYEDDLHWADYSPYAVEEFRDWIRHKGIYADNGLYAGQGVELSRINNNDFSDDPSPNDAGGTGQTFNQFFGTSFTTWKLKYWDLGQYPDMITNECGVGKTHKSSLPYPVSYWNLNDGEGTTTEEVCGNQLFCDQRFRRKSGVSGSDFRHW